MFLSLFSLKGVQEAEQSALGHSWLWREFLKICWKGGKKASLSKTFLHDRQMNLQEELQWWEPHYCIWEHSSSGGTEFTGDSSKERVQREEKEKGRDRERDEGRKNVGALFLKAVLLLATPSTLLKRRSPWVVPFNAKKNKVWISNESQIVLWVTRAVVANESLPEAGSCTSCTAA